MNSLLCRMMLVYAPFVEEISIHLIHLGFSDFVVRYVGTCNHQEPEDHDEDSFDRCPDGKEGISGTGEVEGKTGICPFRDSGKPG